MSLARNNGKKGKAKRKKASGRKKQAQQRAVERGDVNVTRRSEVAESLILRRLGTGGSGAHELSGKQKTRAERRAAKQRGYANENAGRLKTFKAGRAPVRWRLATQSLPSSGSYTERPGAGPFGTTQRVYASDHDLLWFGFSVIPSSVIASRTLSELEQLAEAMEPDWREGQWSQHVMIARTHLHPREWKRHLHEWKGPDPDKFRWSVWGGESISGVSESDLTSLKPGEAKFKIHKTFPLRQNPRYGSLPAIGHAKDAIYQAGFDYNSIQYVRRDTGLNGPVFIFTGVRRGTSYSISVGRINRTDRLEVRYAPIEEPVPKGPAQLPLFGKKNPERFLFNPARVGEAKGNPPRRLPRTGVLQWKRGGPSQERGAVSADVDVAGVELTYETYPVPAPVDYPHPPQVDPSRTGWQLVWYGPETSWGATLGLRGRWPILTFPNRKSAMEAAEGHFQSKYPLAALSRANPYRSAVIGMPSAAQLNPRHACCAELIPYRADLFPKDVRYTELTGHHSSCWSVPTDIRDAAWAQVKKEFPAKSTWDYEKESLEGSVETAQSLVAGAERRLKEWDAEGGPKTSTEWHNYRRFQDDLTYEKQELAKWEAAFRAHMAIPESDRADWTLARRNMRKDMPKVLVTTPRLGHDIQSPDTRRRRREQITEEYEGPSRVPMKPRGHYSIRYLNEYLNPLRRYLQRNAGRPWDEVYSEIRAANPPHSAVSAHIYEHLWDAVELHPVITEQGVFSPRTGSPVAGEWAFYVDYDGILREAPDPRGYAARYRERQEAAGLHLEKKPGRRYATWHKKDPNVKKVDELTYLLRRPSDGVWFEVSYRPVVESRIGERPMTPGRKITKGLTFPDVPGHYPISVRSLSGKEKRGHAVENPGLESEHDPREEAIRSMRQGIYESYVSEAVNRKGDDFRDRSGKRLDALFFERPGPYTVTLYKSSDSPEEVTYNMPGDISAFVNEMLFRQTSKAAQRAGLLEQGSREATPKAARKSLDRHQDLDHLINNRQDYEETLGMGRKSGFYRVLEEPTESGPRWFVWPLAPGQRLPGPGSVRSEEAVHVANQLNRTADPRSTHRWHVPQSGYTEVELANWLPPLRAFGPGVPRVAPEAVPVARPASSSRGTRTKRAVSPKGEKRPSGWIYYLADTSGNRVSPEYAQWSEVWAEYQRVR